MAKYRSLLALRFFFLFGRLSNQRKFTFQSKTENMFQIQNVVCTLTLKFGVHFKPKLGMQFKPKADLVNGKMIILHT